MINSSSKGWPTLGEVRRKEIERDIMDDKQGRLDIVGGREPYRKDAQY